MSASTVSLIVTLVFIIILVIGFFVGFWRGLKKSTANLVFSVIAAIIAFFVTPSISNAVLNIQVESNGTNVPLSQYIVDSLSQDENIAVIIERNPNIKTFIQALPSAIANVLIFIIVMCALQLVIYIIYRIIACFTFKTPVGKKKHRLFGGLVGVAKVFLLTIFAFMPLAGLIGLYDTLQVSNTSYLVQTADSTEEVVIDDPTLNSENESGQGDTVGGDEGEVITPTTDENEPSSIIDDYVPEEVNEIFSGLENNMLIKICGIFGLDNATFDYYSKVDIEENTVYIRQEIENIYPIANFAYKVSSQGNVDIDFEDVDYEKLETFINNFTDGGLFKGIIVDLLSDLIQNYQEYPFISTSEELSQIQDILAPIQVSLQEYSQNHEMLESYFTHDIKELFSAVKSAGESGLLDKAISTQNEEELIDVLFADENLSYTENALVNILEVNMVRDAIAPITQLALSQLGDQFDDVGVDTSTWGEQDWQDLGSSIVNIANDYLNLTETVDIFGIIEDPTILVTDESIDIGNVTTSVGNILDEALSIKLLYTNDGRSIIAKFLEDNNLTLPTEPVYDANGEAVEIDSYSDLFSFVSPALNLVKQNNLYQILNDSQMEKMLSSLADILSQEGNHNLLSQIILPLSQVEPTKTFIVDDLIKTIDTELVSFADLQSYSDWKNDLGYITDLLVTVNSLSDESETSYLTLVLNGSLDVILDDATGEELTSILKPVLYAKSTSNLRDNMFDKLEQVANNLTDEPNQIDISLVTLIEGDSEDQADEICDIFNSFVELNKVYSEGATIKELDKTVLGQFLTRLQANAYRTLLSDKSETGLFNNMFVNLMNTINSQYQDVIELSEELQTMLAVDNYPYINFTDLFDLIEEVESYL